MSGARWSGEGRFRKTLGSLTAELLVELGAQDQLGPFQHHLGPDCQLGPQLNHLQPESCSLQTSLFPSASRGSGAFLSSSSPLLVGGPDPQSPSQDSLAIAPAPRSLIAHPPADLLSNLVSRSLVTIFLSDYPVRSIILTLKSTCFLISNLSEIPTHSVNVAYLKSISEPLK